MRTDHSKEACHTRALMAVDFLKECYLRSPLTRHCFVPATSPTAVGASNEAQVLEHTILVAAIDAGVSAAAGGSLRSNLSRAVQAVLAKGPALALRTGQEEHLLELQVELEPRVPAAFLTSEADSVVPAEGVRRYADRMRAAHEGRCITVRQLDEGKHCTLHKESPEAYITTLEGLFTEAGLCS